MYNIPSSPPLLCMRLFFASASLFPLGKQVHLYHFSRFHINCVNTRGFPGGSDRKASCLPMQETPVRSLGREDGVFPFVTCFTSEGWTLGPSTSLREHFPAAGLGFNLLPVLYFAGLLPGAGMREAQNTSRPVKAQPHPCWWVSSAQSDQETVAVTVHQRNKTNRMEICERWVDR
ncbi:unnamed protein product [Rangifer tarandus platyrhynchus]|uniref:Uncharacterized protein n=1 Tax=Rangifer tarandus platyrhynchus TaxID=3082113 RepID=A0ACB1KFV9_RANTA